ncbi:MAG TPA: SAM-dependent methyltransferase [Kineosporiaceae bacterium]
MGAGIYPQRDLTMGGLRAVKQSSAVLYTHFSGAETWLRELTTGHVENLAGLYQDGAVDRSNYSSMVDRVLSVGQQFGDVVFLVAGHPLLGVTPTQELANRCAADESFQLEIVPGISSLDTMAVDLRVDMLERGCMVLDANRLLIFRYALDPRLALFIYHASSVGNSRTDFLDPARRNQLNLLAEYLIDQLGPERKFVAICSQSNGTEATRIESGRLSELAATVNSIDYGTSLYISASGEVGGFDRQFVERLVSG